MAYTPQTWADNNSAYPVSAARMTNLENGVAAAASTADTALAKVAAGSVSVTPVTNTPTSASVTFPAPFASAPIVVVSAVSAVPGSQVIEVSVSGITTTGCTVYVYRNNTTAMTVNWVAVAA